MGFDVGVSGAGPGPLFLLLIALVIDAAIGDRLARLLPDPAGLAARLCAVLDRRLNRPQRGAAVRLVRGALVVGVLMLAAVLAGLAVGWVGTAAPGGWLVELVALLAVLRGGAARARVQAVRRALEGPGLEAARGALTGLTRRPLHGLDGHAVARAAMEHLAKAFDRKVVAPAFWYALLGVPGLLAWAVVDGADQALGRPGVRLERFGLTAARMDDALNALPARLTGLLLALAAPFAATASPRGALRALTRDTRKHASFNMGWPIAAMAGALGISLVGPYRDGGVTVNEPWLGGGRARALPADVGRALTLTGVAGLLLALLVGLLMAGVAAL
ncbi:cobalamin biosynthesis protein CobD/CbiB [Azospirillum halopraeferens]|uniref:cobalamin biosynthesis protein CobD/CbiB n=1 Tax=Azospirillum halopraeferens TaxID=34010 RepID=UPI000415815F|nr:CobD/CbiB family cobalamin biosynthesis protein [Azospirillum halopraeferens]